MLDTAAAADLERRAKSAFGELVDIAPDERRPALDRLCAGDESLCARVLSLLAAHDHAENFLAPPPPLFGLNLDEASALASAAAGLGGDSNAHAERADTLIGRTVGRFRVVRRLAAGGMGVVYLAEQAHPRREVALKVIRSGLASRALLRRFEHEAEVLGQLQHPGIAQVFEAGTFDIGHGAQPYFAMEYIRGRSLVDHCQAGELSIPQRLELLARIADAVHYAHQKGVIHRDLKPENILVVDETSTRPHVHKSTASHQATERSVDVWTFGRVDVSAQPKILDFGVARAIDSDVALTTLQTDLGQLIGTLPYMSPEQVAGDPRQVDTRSDVYALGVIGWQMLTGEMPLDVRHKSVAQAARIIEQIEPPPLSAYGKVFRGDLNTIFAKALEKDRARRYQSASELAEDIRRYLRHEPIAARPATTLYQLHKFARRNRALVAGLAGVFVMLVVGVIGTTTGLLQARESERIALQQEETAERAAIEADRQRVAAEQISVFLQQMLASVNPSTALGRDTALLREILDTASARVERELQQQPDIAATLHGVIGRTYASIAEDELAIAHLTTALETRRQFNGPESIEAAAAKGDLGRVLLSASRFDEAGPLLRHALEAARRVYGDDSPITAVAIADVANYRRRIGDFEGSERLLRDSVAILERTVEATETRRLRAMHDLAVTLHTRHKFQEARALYERVLSVRQRTRPADSPEIAIAHTNVGLVMREMGEVDGALAHVEKALAIYRRILPPGHGSLATALQSVGMVHYERDDYEKAEPYLVEALEVAREAHGDEHPEVARLIANQSDLASALDQPAEAEQLCLRALEMRRKTLPPDHHDIARSLRQLTGIRFRQGKTEQAVSLAHQALEIFRVRAAGDYDMCSMLLSLAAYEYRYERFEEAERLAREAVDMLARLLGERHGAVSSAWGRLATILEARQQHEEALRWRRRALQARIERGDADNEVMHARESVGRSLMALERHAEAEAELREALDLCIGFFGEGDVPWARSTMALGECLLRQRRYDEAEPLLMNAERILRERNQVPHVTAARKLIAELHAARGRPAPASQPGR